MSRASRTTSASTCLALCCALILSSISIAVPGSKSAGGNGDHGSGWAAQRTQGPPSQNLPNLNEARRIKPAPPKVAAPVPATKCRRRDEACKRAKGEKAENRLPVNGNTPDRLWAYSGLGRSEGVKGFDWRGFRILALDDLIEDASRAISDLPTAWSPGAPAASAGLMLQSESDMAAAQLDPNNRKGTPGEDLLSRNFNWSLPLLSLPGRAGLDLGFGISYNSLTWIKLGTTMQFDPDWGTPTPGFRLGFPSVQRYYFNSQAGTWAYLLILPSGQHVELRQVGTNVYEAIDSSYLHLTYNPGDFSLTLRVTDGTQLRFQYQADEYKCTEIKDRNGNYITINYGAGYASDEISTIVDTLGRVITFNYDTYAHLNSITQTWGGQTHTWVTFAYGTQTIQTNFPGLTLVGAMNGGNMSVLTRIGLDDGSVYSFEYNTYCQVRTIRRYSPNVSNPQTFPNDYFQRAYITYNLPADASATQTDCPRFTTKTDWAHEWNPGAVTSTYGPATPNWAWGEVTLPDGTVNKEIFATSGWQRGLTTQTETWSGGVRKKWTALQWTQDNTAVSYLLNPRVMETNVYDDAGNHRRATIGYTSYGLPLDVYEYEANATTVLRRTHTDYNLSSTYTSRRIIGLPSAQYLYDGSNNLFSKVDYQYDLGDEFQVHQGPPIRHDTANYGSGFVQGRGNLNNVRRWDTTDPNNAAKVSAYKTGYNTSGSVIFRRDPLNHQTSFSYMDSFSDLADRNSLAYPTAVTDADNFLSTIQYNFDFGAVTRTQDPKGAAVTRTYDAAGRTDRITNQVNGAYTRYVYPHYLYHVLSFTTVNDLNPANEFYSLTLFDGHDRVRAVASENPTSVGQYKAQFNAYDSMGRLWMQSRPTEIFGDWNCAGDDQAFGWGAGLWITQLYDWQGRPTITTNQNGTTKEISYGGCGCAGGDVITVKDEGQTTGGSRRTQKIFHDVMGRAVKTQVFEWNGTTVYSTTTNTYNVRDQITNIKLQVGETGAEQNTVMDYDGHGRLKTRQLPIYLGNPQSATPHMSYEYHADDTLMRVTDPRGASATYGYNNRHLVTSISHVVPSGVAPTSNVAFAYDEAGNRTSMADGLGTVTYDYDTLSRMNWERRYFNDLGQNYTLSYEYNLVGGVKRITDPWGASVTYVYNKAGEVTGITGVGYADINQWTNRTVSQFASNIKYRAWGAIKSFTNGNFAAEKSAFALNYDTRLQITRFDGGGRVTDHTFYNDGRVKDIADSTWSSFNPRSYNYDFAGRLTSATAGTGSPRPYSLIYAQDVWGNTTSRTGSHWSSTLTPYVPTYSNNRSIGSTGWTYDVSGNVIDTSGPNVNPPAMKYDAEGRLASVFTASSFIGYLTEHGYDGDGQRVRYSSDFLSGYPATATTYHHLRSSVLGGAVIAEVVIKRFSDPDEVSSNSYIYLNKERIAYQKNAHLSGADKEVVWIYRNPVINTNYEHNRLNVNGQPTDWWTESVTDPTGSLVTTYDPGSLPQIPPPTIGPIESGGMNDFGDCYMDGVRSPCGIVMWMMERGWAMEAPWDNTTSVRNPISGQYELAIFTVDWDNGYYGFVPLAANYGGNGTWSWKSHTTGRPTLKPRGTAFAGEDDQTGEAGRIRRNIDALARKYIGSQLWREDVAKSGIPVGQNKCNQFINDVIVEAGGVKPLVPYKNEGGITGSLKALFLRGPTASEWGDPTIKIPGWEIVQPINGTVVYTAGDIIAVSRPDGTGHVGIFVGLPGGRTVVSANANVTPKGLITATQWGFRMFDEDSKRKIARRYVGVPRVDNPYSPGMPREELCHLK